MLRGIVGVALVCALAGVVHADNKEAAKEAYSEGKRHYDLGEYDAALTAFKKAYLNYEEPVFLFNIAQCYRALGDRPAAVRSYRAFLRNWPKAPNREQVERIVAELDQAIAQDQSAKAAPPQDTLSPPKPNEPNGAPAAGTSATGAAKTGAAAAATPPAGAGQAAPADAHAAVASTTPSPSPGAPAATREPTPATQHAPPPEEPAGMVEVEPNFDRPSGSAKPVKWWAWTLIAVGVGGLVAAAVVIGVTQSQAKFDTTLPQFNVSNSALHAVSVHF
jgi:hypothetical protein